MSRRSPSSTISPTARPQVNRSSRYRSRKDCTPRWPQPVSTVRKNSSRPAWARLSRHRTPTPPHSRASFQTGGVHNGHRLPDGPVQGGLPRAQGHIAVQRPEGVPLPSPHLDHRRGRLLLPPAFPPLHVPSLPSRVRSPLSKAPPLHAPGKKSTVSLPGGDSCRKIPDLVHGVVVPPHPAQPGGGPSLFPSSGEMNSPCGNSRAFGPANLRRLSRRPACCGAPKSTTAPKSSAAPRSRQKIHRLAPGRRQLPQNTGSRPWRGRALSSPGPGPGRPRPSGTGRTPGRRRHTPGR